MQPYQADGVVSIWHLWDFALSDAGLPIHLSLARIRRRRNGSEVVACDFGAKLSMGRELWEVLEKDSN